MDIRETNSDYEMEKRWWWGSNIYNPTLDYG